MMMSRRRVVQIAIAAGALVILALLKLVGVPLLVIVCLAGAGLIVCGLVVRRSRNRETQKIFDFYISADEVLGNQEQQRYAFEVSDVINRGERVFYSMPDPPPLTHFALGALYHHVGDFQGATEMLAPVVADYFAETHHTLDPSHELRRYVKRLRRIERKPARSPRAFAAIQNLDRAKAAHANDLFTESRTRLEQLIKEKVVDEADAPKLTGARVPHLGGFGPVTTRPPISDLLRQVYDEDGKSS
jgi:hypothetical protein